MFGPHAVSASDTQLPGRGPSQTPVRARHAPTKGTTEMSTTFLPRTATLDDERRAPMGLLERDRCRECGGPAHRTDASGLCWACMPVAC